ncbi:MAG: competence protein ComK [Clostridium sp.]|nr:competence protein ComK [Clostridium sp.]MCM1443772.1 competence protein ComK [Candidatus Amulumruptor caecigallinarius]
MEHYEINDSTLAIKPLNDATSIVYEKDRNFTINQKTTQIINYSCKYFGSSYQGRFEGAKDLLGMNYKLPIIIEESKEIIFFPTSSPRYENCCWISLKNIENYIKKDNSVIINFKNGVNLDFDLSINSLENQIFRALRLEKILKTRKTAII